MNNPFGKILNIVVAAIVLFIFPIVYFSLRQDTLVEQVITAETGTFLNSVSSKGYLTKEMYDTFLSEIDATGIVGNVSIESQEYVAEPEYVFKSVKDITNEQDGLYTGSNLYNYFPVSTQKPIVNDPIPSGSLNSETNASILSKAVNLSNSPSHVHTSACYNGHRHTGSTSVYGGCYTTSAYHSHTSSCYQSYSFTHTHTSSCYTTTTTYCPGIIIWTYKEQASAIHYGGCWGTITYDRYTGVCSLCGASKGTYGINNHCTNNDYEYAGSLPITCDKATTATVLTCGLVEGAVYSGSALICGKTEGVTIEGYSLSCGQSEDNTLDCGKIVSSIIPTNPIQTVAIGDPLITTITVTHSDGSTQCVVGTTSFSTASLQQNQQATITYSYSIDGTSYTKTCTITVTVIPRSKTCLNGHIYNLNNDGSDPGCPYCAAWLSKLEVAMPSNGLLTIYKGSALEANGVIVKATYMNGRTELLYSGYAHNLDKNYVGEQDVTISYKGLYTSLHVTVKRNLTQCPICGRHYELYPDGTDPGCPYEIAKIPVFTGNVLKYYSGSYGSEILNELYDGSGIYYFKKGDNFTINVTNKSKTLGIRLLGLTIPGLPIETIRVIKTGIIRDDIKD